MRIALLTDEYLPTGVRVHAKMIHELAIEFERNGHSAVVITPGYPDQSSRLIIDSIDGIEVWRFRSGYTRGVGLVRRAINEWLLSFRAWHAIAAGVNANGFDLCINYSPTIFFGPLARKLKQKGTYIYQIQRDMFPQWAIDQGLISQRSLPALFFRYYERLNYSVADCIGLQSKVNLELFREAFPSYKNVKILMNWSSTSPLLETEGRSTARKDYSLSGKIVFFYGGNIGHGQDMANIMRLAKNLVDYDVAHFLIVGQGDEFDLIKELKSRWELNNVTILPSVSQLEFRRILTTVDIGLFSLSNKHTAHNFPGKLLGYMVESIPILGSVNHGNDLLTLVNEHDAGFVYVNGQDDLLMRAAMKLLEDKEMRQDRGMNARALLLQYFSVKSAATSILQEVRKQL
jgi:glycosyltransferase involved in cell wall biosynthesis